MLVAVVVLGSPFGIHALDGDFELQNFFHHTVHDGQLGAFLSSAVGVIKEIHIKPADRAAARGGLLFPAFIVLVGGRRLNVTANDFTRDATDMGSLQLFFEEVQGDIINFHVIAGEKGIYWYSYAVMVDFRTGALISSQGRQDYMIFTGVMVRKP